MEADGSPSGDGGLFDRVEIRIEAIGPVVAAEIVPEVFDGVEFGGIGWERDEGDRHGDAESLGDVVAGVVPDEGDVSAGGDRRGELVEEDLHDRGVEPVGDETFSPAGLRADDGEDVETLEAALFRGGWSGAGVGPNGGQRALLAEPGFVLEPDFDGLARVGGRDLREDGGEFFLNASCVTMSAFGCFGRGRSTENPNACNRL